MAEIKKVVLRNGRTRYRTVIDVGRKPDGKRNQLTITENTKTEVRNEVDRIRGQMASGTYIAPSRITLAGWIDQWMTHKARNVEETTLAGYRDKFAQVREQLGHVRLQELTEDIIQAFADDLVARGRRRRGRPGTRLAVSYVNSILRQLRECLARAVVRKLIHSNPAQFVKISLADRKTDRREHRREKPWTVTEVQTFVKGIEQDRMHAPLLLSLMGLRPAEVVGMRWSDIDLKLGTLETANTRTMIYNRDVVEKDTKTEAGERGLPLPQWPWEALKKFRAQQAREKLAAGEAYTDSGYVVVDGLGMPLTTRQLRERHAYRLMASLGLRKVRLYDVRASCLTYLANNGVPDHILARWAGHTNVKTTKKWYVKPDVEDLRSAAAAWDVFHGGDTGRS